MDKPEITTTSSRVAYENRWMRVREDRIAYARQFYNDSVLSYNNRIQSFPGNMIAGTFNFTQREYFEGDPEATGPVKVQF